MKKLKNFVEDVNVFEYRTKKAPAADVDPEKAEGKPAEKNGSNGKWAIDEPKDNDAQDDIDLNSPDNTESMEDLIDKFDAEEDFFIIGEAGWGKTSIIKNLSRKYKRKVITFYLDKCEATDLGGIPVVTKGANGKARQEVTLPPFAQYMEDHADENFLLFFDEMNQAAPDVMNALMPIVLEHEIAGTKFDNFFVGAAGNFEHENDAVNELSGPLKSRFKPLITWETSTDNAWKSSFSYLHKKWDKLLSKDLIDAFEANATCFVNPREVELKIFKFAAAIKGKPEAAARNKPEKLLRRLKNLAKDNLSRSQETALSKLAESLYNFIAGKETKQSERKSKDINMVDKKVREAIEFAMRNGYILDKSTGTKYGVSRENIGLVTDPDECNAEMLERIINKFEADGTKFKYEKNSEWKKDGYKDPMEED